MLVDAKLSVSTCAFYEEENNKMTNKIVMRHDWVGTRKREYLK